MNSRDCLADPTAAFEVNGVNTSKIVSAAIRQGVSRFIYLSTAHVYGGSLNGSVTEETCTTPAHPYATSHLAGEEPVLGAHERQEIEGILLRLSNAYGAPLQAAVDCWTLLVNDLRRQAVTTGHMELRSTGLQRSDFVPMKDACRAIEHFLRLRSEELDQGLFNVGGRSPLTVWEMARLVQDRCEALLGVQSELTLTTPLGEETFEELEYRVDAMARTGFELSADRIAEVDGLVEFCIASFR